MKKYFALVPVIVLLIAGCKQQDPYNPKKFLNEQEIRNIIHSTIRYSAKLPPMATHETKFDTAHDAYYNAVAADYDLRAWSPTDGGKSYFLMTRVARSLTPMREAIGGTVQVDSQGNVIHYREIFRTWKMADSLLVPRGSELFKAMVMKKDLTPYTTKYRADQYIEFPDERFIFDTTSLRWRDRELDSLSIN